MTKKAKALGGRCNDLLTTAYCADTHYVYVVNDVNGRLQRERSLTSAEAPEVVR